jgi:site-specific DNA-methyltransferase (cytosine-N4-specific)
LAKRKKKAQLILSSPPFPLNNKKQYGNLSGDDYLNWLSDLAPLVHFITAYAFCKDTKQALR